MANKQPTVLQKAKAKNTNKAGKAINWLEKTDCALKTVPHCD